MKDWLHNGQRCGSNNIGQSPHTALCPHGTNAWVFTETVQTTHRFSFELGEIGGITNGT